MRRLLTVAAAAALSLGACAPESATSPSATPSLSPAPADVSATPDPESAEPPGTAEVDAVTEFTVTEHGAFNEGWAMTFLPGTGYLLISERVGALQLRNQETGEVRPVDGVPEVHHVGQAGLHDVVAGPTFHTDGTIYLSWVRPADGGAQGVVARAILDTEAATLHDLEIIWEQTPASGNGHFSLRLLIQGEYLFVTSGERQEMVPAQGMDTNLGKVVRLTLEGEPAPGNPFADQGGVAAQFWTIGHRNPLGIAADSHGNVWVSEMGPQGGDELNFLVEGENYGWPVTSNGQHYGGGDIPDHQPGDGFAAPAAYWVPSISPGSLAIYQGELFTGWQDSALIGGLSGQCLVRVALGDEGSAEIAQQWDMGARIRAVDESPDGSIWLLEDGARGRLLELRPVS